MFKVLTGMAPWLRHCPTSPKVTGSIPGQGKHLGCRPGPLLAVCKRQLMFLLYIDVSATLSKSK